VFAVSDLDVLIDELHKVVRALDTSMRECTALACSIVIASGISGLDTPEKVVTACKMVHDEFMRQMREEKLT